MILPSANADSPNLALLLGLVAALAYILPAFLAPRLGAAAARGVALVAWILHALALAWSLLGDVPRFGFAPALSFGSNLSISTNLPELWTK